MKKQYNLIKKNITMTNIEEDESILNSGIQSIIDAFKIQSDKYNSIITSLNQKIEIISSQNEQ